MGLTSLAKLSWVSLRPECNRKTLVRTSNLFFSETIIPLPYSLPYRRGASVTELGLSRRDPDPPRCYLHSTSDLRMCVLSEGDLMESELWCKNSYSKTCWQSQNSNKHYIS